MKAAGYIFGFWLGMIGLCLAFVAVVAISALTYDWTDWAIHEFARALSTFWKELKT